jgi:hypothetical protein
LPGKKVGIDVVLDHDRVVRFGNAQNLTRPLLRCQELEKGLWAYRAGKMTSNLQNCIGFKTGPVVKNIWRTVLVQGLHWRLGCKRKPALLSG